MDVELFLKFLPFGVGFGFFIFGVSKFINSFALKLKEVEEDLKEHKKNTLDSNDKIFKSIEKLTDIVIVANQSNKDALNNSITDHKLHEKDFYSLEKRVLELEKHEAGIEYIGQVLSSVFGDESLKSLRRKQS